MPSKLWNAISQTNADFLSIWSLETVELLIHQNAFENVVCEMAAILSRGDELN